MSKKSSQKPRAKVASGVKPKPLPQAEAFAKALNTFERDLSKICREFLLAPSNENPQHAYMMLNRMTKLQTEIFDHLAMEVQAQLACKRKQSDPRYGSELVGLAIAAERAEETAGEYLRRIVEHKDAITDQLAENAELLQPKKDAPRVLLIFGTVEDLLAKLGG